MSKEPYVNVNGADDKLRFDYCMSINGDRDINRALARLGNALSKKEIEKAIRAARFRSVRAGKTLGAKLAREKYTAKSHAIKRRFVATLVNNGAQAGVRFNGFPGMNMIHFMARPNTDVRPGPRRGVSVKIKRYGARYVPTGKQDNSSRPFVAKIYKNKSEMGIFVRYGRGKTRHMLYGPSPIQALLSRDYQGQIMDRMKDVFAQRLTHELEARVEGLVRGSKH